jgi:hypothetical protein
MGIGRHGYPPKVVNSRITVNDQIGKSDRVLLEEVKLIIKWACRIKLCRSSYRFEQEHGGKAQVASGPCEHSHSTSKASMALAPIGLVPTIPRAPQEKIVTKGWVEYNNNQSS